MLTDDLRAEGRALDLIRELNGMRKDAGLELTDRVRVVLPAALADLLDHAQRIKDDVLAVSVDVDESVELIVLVSKPPAPEVAAVIEAYIASLGTPVELALLGPGRPDLTAATEAVLRRLGRDVRGAAHAARDDGHLPRVGRAGPR